MKPFIKTILFLFIDIHYGLAQDSIVLLSPKMFDKDQKIILSDFDGWLFKKGNDSSCSDFEMPPGDWKKLKPGELSPSYADETGRVEGWFRMKFSLDPAFDTLPLGLERGSWSATDIYLDGRLFRSYGNTGSKSNYKEYNPIDKLAEPTNLKTGEEHVMAVHFVDYISPLLPSKLKSQATIIGAELHGLRSLIMLNGPKFNSVVLKDSKEKALYRSIWVSVTSILALLFWLLAVQRPAEKKTLLLIAAYSSFSALSNLTRFFYTSPDVSFQTYWVSYLLFNLFTWLVFVFTLLIVIHILKFEISRAVKWFITIFSILGAGTVFFPFFLGFLYSATILSCLIYGYIIIFSLKKLQGAQWSIVVGLSLSLLFAVTFSLSNMKTTYNVNSNNWRILLTCFYFSFPFSLIVYVSLRFREILWEVKENAEKVVKMTREREELAVRQQKVLEEEVARQTAELRSALENLKATQSQLIQSEKMASLGELTAGIAHEIQNPLNFVNNFSEVNKELLAEMKDEMNKGNIDDAKAIADDVIDNQEKINYHGKRADAIVKGMLQHSRSSSGVKEPTNINALADEYLRLAYHGLRAKDKSLNATMKTDFDEAIGNVSIIPQDIGRVILNLITNAFYAVDEKKKQQAVGYEPTVSVSTKKINGKFEISVKDNGSGIPQKVLDKIFQPFFTTKPTGQGTGLGLSLAYDIIKAHGGEIEVETKEGEGTEFIIQLPLT